MTAAQRLALLSGLSSGTAAQHLRALAIAGGLAGALLVGYSGLPTGTASQHLLVDHTSTQVYDGIRVWREERNWVAVDRRVWLSAPFQRVWVYAPDPRAWVFGLSRNWNLSPTQRSWAEASYPVNWTKGTRNDYWTT